MNAFDAISEVIRERFDAIDTDCARKARFAATCPASMLGHLGWSRGLDYWETGWSESIKRELIRTTPYRLRLRGTRRAIESAIDSFGGEIQLVEWWQADPVEANMTAEVVIAIGGAIGSSGNTQDQILRLLQREGRAALKWNLFVEAGGSAAIAVESYMRVTVLTQHSGVQVG